MSKIYKTSELPDFIFEKTGARFTQSYICHLISHGKIKRLEKKGEKRSSLVTQESINEFLKTHKFSSNIKNTDTNNEQIQNITNIELFLRVSDNLLNSAYN